jgi:predicted nucleic acid-binding Zn ribbon protein
MGKEKRSFTPIKEVIDNIFKSSVLHIDFDDMRIWKLWDGVVGKETAKHARPSWIKKGVLMVKVTDSVWLQDLEFKAEIIKECLNRKLQRKAIKRIRLRVGAPQAQESKQISKKRSQQEHIQDLTPERQRKMEEIIAQIKDKEIRESLRQMILAAKKDNVR